MNAPVWIGRRGSGQRSSAILRCKILALALHIAPVIPAQAQDLAAPLAAPPAGAVLPTLDGGAYSITTVNEQIQATVELPLAPALGDRQTVTVAVPPETIIAEQGTCRGIAGAPFQVTVGTVAQPRVGEERTAVPLTFGRIACAGNHRFALRLSVIEHPPTADANRGTRLVRTSQQIVEVRFRSPPVLALVSPSVQEVPALDVASCWACLWPGRGKGLDVWMWATSMLAPQLTPGAAERQMRIMVRNASLGPVLVNARIIGRGATPAAAVAALRFAPDDVGRETTFVASLKDLLLGSGEELDITLRPDWSAGRIPTGAQDLSLVVEARSVGLDEAVPAVLRVPVRLNVRHPIGWLVLALALGVWVGRMLAITREPAYAARLGLFQRLQVVKDRLRDLDDVEARKVLMFAADDLTARVEAGAETAATLETGVAALERCSIALLRIAALSGSMAGNGAAEAALARARLAAMGGRADEADDEIKAALATVPAPAGALAPQRNLFDPAPSDRRRIQRTPVWLRLVTSPGALPLPLVSRYVAPGLRLVLLGVTLLFGLDQFYFSGARAATLGAGGLTDYLPAFLWGLTAMAVTRSLDTLTWTAAGR